MVDEQFIREFPEIHLENYDVVDVERLNGWAIEAAAALAMAVVEIRTLKTHRIDRAPLEMALRVASEYGTKDSQIDSGNLYAALRQCLDRIDVLECRIASSIHYPECWDTACYTSVDEALHEMYAWFKCTNDDCAQKRTDLQHNAEITGG